MWTVRIAGDREESRGRDGGEKKPDSEETGFFELVVIGGLEPPTPA